MTNDSISGSPLTPLDAENGKETGVAAVGAVAGFSAVFAAAACCVLPAALACEGRDTMRRWYIDTGQMWLNRRITTWAARAGVGELRVEVRDLGYRWGSVRPGANDIRINIHWATLQLPPSLIDYVLVHELAHLTETNHTPAYWAIVGRIMPGYEGQKQALASIGKNVWLG